MTEEYAAALRLEERVARAIYETHWVKGKAPAWDDASQAVRDWVRDQARAAITAYETFNATTP